MKKFKTLNFIMKIKDFEIPLSYSINIGDIESFEKMDDSFLDNVYSFNFNLTITGMIFSPFSRENQIKPFNGKFEIILFGEKTSFDIENEYNERISVIEDDGGIVTFSDLIETTSQTNEIIEMEKRLFYK
jgi:hypothetical protein